MSITTTNDDYSEATKLCAELVWSLGVPVAGNLLLALSAHLMTPRSAVNPLSWWTKAFTYMGLRTGITPLLPTLTEWLKKLAPIGTGVLLPIFSTFFSKLEKLGITISVGNQNLGPTSPGFDSLFYLKQWFSNLFTWSSNDASDEVITLLAKEAPSVGLGMIDYAGKLQAAFNFLTYLPTDAVHSLANSLSNNATLTSLTNETLPGFVDQTLSNTLKSSLNGYASDTTIAAAGVLLVGYATWRLGRWAVDKSGVLPSNTEQTIIMTKSI